MKPRRSLYARPESFRGQQCAEAPAGRRRSAPQPTVAAVARSVRSSMVPLGSLLLRRPGSLLAQTASARRSVQPASAVGRRRGRHCQDASHSVGRRSVSTMRCPLTDVVVWDPAVQPSGVQPSGVRSPGFVVRGPAVRTVGVHPSSVQPSGVHPSGVQPSGVQPVWCPPRPSGRVRLLPPQAVALGNQMGAAGQPAPRERVEVPVAAAPSSGSVSGRGLDDRGRRCRGRGRWGVGGVPAGLGAGGGGRACPLPDQAGQAGMRSTRGWRLREGRGAGASARLLHRQRGCRRGLGGRPRWVVVVAPVARVGGPGGADGRAGGDGRTAPARPRPAAGATGLRAAAL
jgi:hypothetical protein